MDIDQMRRDAEAPEKADATRAEAAARETAGDGG